MVLLLILLTPQTYHDYLADQGGFAPTIVFQTTTLVSAPAIFTWQTNPSFLIFFPELKNQRFLSLCAISIIFSSQFILDFKLTPIQWRNASLSTDAFLIFFSFVLCIFLYHLAGPRGFEPLLTVLETAVLPLTPWAYNALKRWRCRPDLNRGIAVLQTAALTTWPRHQNFATKVCTCSTPPWRDYRAPSPPFFSKSRSIVSASPVFCNVRHLMPSNFTTHNTKKLN